MFIKVWMITFAFIAFVMAAYGSWYQGGDKDE